ncbi:hypothetical protein [Mycolicibacterium arenosum]|uniref:DUF5642 domain-containing protein n=1 Tax=Mycolicibacterium arenosum TaxID=2952157 RepID=A0ABT1MAS9_9MYCO|nr:hypothetical protein [Mycolicibacterium sp. CAU 1645]MCP9276281.1 hypothetical protein [Mycolicibacterium sp. CAU 1645]
MSSGPQGPGWWCASDGRWYPPQPAVPAARRKSTRGIWIAVLAVVVVLIAGVGIGGYLIVRAVTNEVSSALGVGDLECPASGDIGELLGSPVSGPAGGSMIVASGCYYTGAVYDVIIVSGSTLIADEQIASMVGEGEAGGAEVRDIDVGDKGRVWASDTKSSAIAVGADALVSVEVQGKDFASIPDRSDAAVAILERVLR